MTSISDYVPSKAGLTEKYIILEPIQFLSSYSVPLQLKNYEIINQGIGPIFIEKIIKQVLSSKLNIICPINFQKLWHETLVLKLKCSLKDYKGRLFSNYKPNSLKEINEHYIENSNRLDIIQKYKNTPPKELPLYFSSNLILQYQKNSKICPNKIYMIDGSKRIIASALRHEKFIDIYLIIHETELKNFIDSSKIQNIEKKISEIPWFPKYQDLNWFNIKGRRDSQRFQLLSNFNSKLFLNSTIIDFGCNIGQTCFKVFQSGAKQVYGLDVVPESLKIANQIKDFFQTDQIEFLQVDFNDKNFIAKIEQNIAKKADFCFFLSVYRTKELTQRDKLLDYVYEKSKFGVIFEGHGFKQDTKEFYQEIFNKRKWKYKYLGLAESGKFRPLFFIEKQ